MPETAFAHALESPAHGPNPLHAAVLRGVDAALVDVDVKRTVDYAPFTLSGLPPATVRETSARVRAALAALGYSFPTDGLAVTLTPPGPYRHLPGLDVPIALALLVERGELKSAALGHTMAVGELGFAGQLHAIRGAVSIAEAALHAGYTTLVVPAANAAESSLVPGLTILPATSLGEVLRHLKGHSPLCAHAAPPFSPEAVELDMADVPGQHAAKEAMELAAAGGHSLLLLGPLGSSRAVLARRLRTLLPHPTDAERLDIARLYSAAGLLQVSPSLAMHRPFRAPHHTISDLGLLGGGPLGCPGELSLAHHGVLYLDEVHELRTSALDTLHHWLERGQVHLVRRDEDVLYPCRPLLIATAEDCPCGQGPGSGRCRCRPESLARHHSNVDKVLRRFHLIAPTHLAGHERGGDAPRPSAWYRARVERAREIQANRFRAVPGVDCNARMPASLVPALCPLSPSARAALDAALARLSVPGDVQRQLLTVARTRADLDGRDLIEARDMEVALAHQPRLAASRLLNT